MLTGLLFVVTGIAVLLYPRLLVVLLASFLILVGLGFMVASWQFKRLRRHSSTSFVNWLIPF